MTNDINEEADRLNLMIDLAYKRGNSTLIAYWYDKLQKLRETQKEKQDGNNN